MIELKEKLAAPLSPLARPLVDLLIRRIDSGKLAAGDRLPTFRSLAQQHGVSYYVAQSAIAYLEQMRLVESLQGSGTYVRDRRPRKAGPEGSSQVFILCNDVPETFAGLIHPIALRLQQASMFVTPLDYGYDGSRLAELEPVFRRWPQSPPRAVLLKGSFTPVVEMVCRYAPADTCLVGIHALRSTRMSNWHMVLSDERKGYYLAARRLLERGHRRLGLVGMRRDPSTKPADGDRHATDQHLLGILDACAELKLRRSLTLHMNRRTEQDPWGLGQDVANVGRLARWLTRPNRPTGVMVGAHRVGCIKLAARRAGLRIGTDFELITFGDPRPAFEGEFDCVWDQCQLVAQHIVEIVSSHKNGGSGVVKQIVVPPVLVERRQHETVAGRSEMAMDPGRALSLVSSA